MSISNDFLNQLKLQVDIVDLIQHYGVHLSRSGGHHKGLCPFHSERSPSFFVYESTQSFYCFGCQAGGDAITFVMKYQHLDYREALELLAKQAGVSLPSSNESSQSRERKSKILAMNKLVALHFFHNLNAPESSEARNYLKHRGLTHETIKKYGLGYALDDWSNTVNFLRQKGFSQEEIVSANLGAYNKNKKLYDQFRHRIIFPIIDLKGNVVAFGGRNLSAQGPKYLNSAETPVFFKNRTLFSLNFAKNEKSDTLILVEGYMDVISLYQAGFKNVVATLGTAMGEMQGILLAKYAKQVILCYDTDEAGKKATKRAIDMLKKTPLAVKVLNLQNAKDPDEYVKKFGTIRFKNLLNQSDDYFHFQLATIKLKYNLETTQGLRDYVKEACVLLAELYTQTEVNIYASQVSKETNIPLQAIVEDIKAQKKQHEKKEKKQERKELLKQTILIKQDKVNLEKQEHFEGALAEEALLSTLLKQPDLVSFAKKHLNLDQMITSLNRQILKVIYENSDSFHSVDLMMLGQHFPLSTVEHLSQHLAKSDGISYTSQGLQEIIEKIISYKNTPKETQLKSMETQELMDYITHLKKEKTGRCDESK